MSQIDRELSEIVDFAVDLARRAGELVMTHYREVAVEWKPDGSEVTEADRRAEVLIREALERDFPDAAILGEEYGGEKAPCPGDQWIVDPIDGTTAFTLGVPLFGTLLALLRDGEPVVGVIHMPALAETLYAATGHGCHWRLGDEAPVATRCDPVGKLADAFASSCGLHASELEPVPGRPNYRLGPLVAACRKFRVVGDCYQHLLVCRGRLHLAIDAIMEPWDSAALVPCVREAGGVVSGLTGRTENVVFAGSLVSASDAALHSQAIATINTVR